LAVVLVAAGFLVTKIAGLLGGDDPASGVAGLPALVEDRAPPAERTVDVHAGYGTWVDVFDYLPSRSGEAKVTPQAVEDMARVGVHTLYLQAARFDQGGAGLLADPDLIAQILVRAHMSGMQVVGWYVPRFTDIDRDLAYLAAIADFEVLGHRFDGIAIDIEVTSDVPDHAQRSDELVELSERLRETVGDDAVGAIVLPPVQLEVINPAKWPKFPWGELADLYDVWLPMGYWTERRPESGYNDGWTYTEDNVDRLRHDLDDPDAVIHFIGGIGDQITAAQAERFVEAVTDEDVIGASVYDWATLDATVSAQIAAGLKG
jgi:hypothetical protein